MEVNGEVILKYVICSYSKQDTGPTSIDTG